FAYIGWVSEWSLSRDAASVQNCDDGRGRVVESTVRLPQRVCKGAVMTSNLYFRAVILLSLALAIIGCEAFPTSPELPTPSAALDAEAPGTRVGGSQEAATPLLKKLLGAAMRQAASSGGESAVRRLRANLDQLHSDARAAAAAGDRELARRNLHAAKLLSARFVLRVQGPQILDRVVANVAGELPEVDRRLAAAAAAGRDVVNLQRAADRVGALLRRANAADGGGNAAAALVHATDAFDLLQRLKSALS
ncbi:MAG: hypothetical protein WD766_05720, partial [Gemmatimonadota bacterium]